jgi:hypothetical protein
MLDDWLTPTEASKLVGKSRHDIYYHVYREHFKVVRKGGTSKRPRFFIERKSLVEYFEKIEKEK